MFKGQKKATKGERTEEGKGKEWTKEGEKINKKLKRQSKPNKQQQQNPSPTHTHARARSHTHIHAHTYARPHAHTHTHARTHTPAHARTRTHTYTHTRTHARTHAHTHIFLSLLLTWPSPLVRMSALLSLPDDSYLGTMFFRVWNPF